MWTGLALIILGSVGQALEPMVPGLGELGKHLSEVGWGLAAIGLGHKIEKASILIRGGKE